MSPEALAQAIAGIEQGDYSCHILRRRDGSWSCDLFDRQNRTTRHHHGWGHTLDVALANALQAAASERPKIAVRPAVPPPSSGTDDYLDASDFL